MTKYIDADSLRAEIKFAKSVYDDPKRVVYGVADAYRQDGRAAMCDDILKKIDSLQQEQPKPSGYDKALLEVKSKVDELYEEASIGLSEYDSGLYNGIAETCMKLRGFIKARLDSEEQPEVDIEKEIDAIWNPRFNLGWDEHSALSMNHAGFASIARHFFALGLNARKEA